MQTQVLFPDPLCKITAMVITLPKLVGLFESTALPSMPTCQLALSFKPGKGGPKEGGSWLFKTISLLVNSWRYAAAKVASSAYASLAGLRVHRQDHWHVQVRSYISTGIWRQGIVLKHRISLRKSLCPVVICPYFCNSEQRATEQQMPTTHPGAPDWQVRPETPAQFVSSLLFIECSCWTLILSLFRFGSACSIRPGWLAGRPTS